MKNNTEEPIQNRKERPDSIFLSGSSNNYKGISCKNLLKNFYLTEDQIEEILSKNESKQIKIIVNYIDELYKAIQKSNINIEPDISTYIYKVFTDEVEE
ncbi:MAG: hypothetical protein PHR61_02950 [Candidatus Absconditabacteria bacterium]|nr:hypothetical protein [Candidatus Absconditabacteria bacterium]